MVELEPGVLAAIERLEAQPETAWDKDLLRVREWQEGALMPGEEGNLMTRFISDSEFCRLVMPVFVAKIEAGYHRKWAAEAADKKAQAIWEWRRRREARKGSRRRRKWRVTVWRLRRRVTSSAT